MPPTEKRCRALRSIRYMGSSVPSVPQSLAPPSLSWVNGRVPTRGTKPDRTRGRIDEQCSAPPTPPRPTLRNNRDLRTSPVGLQVVSGRSTHWLRDERHRPPTVNSAEPAAMNPRTALAIDRASGATASTARPPISHASRTGGAGNPGQASLCRVGPRTSWCWTSTLTRPRFRTVTGYCRASRSRSRSTSPGSPPASTRLPSSLPTVRKRTRPRTRRPCVSAPPQGAPHLVCQLRACGSLSLLHRFQPQDRPRLAGRRTGSWRVHRGPHHPYVSGCVHTPWRGQGPGPAPRLALCRTTAHRPCHTDDPGSRPEAGWTSAASEDRRRAGALAAAHRDRS